MPKDCLPGSGCGSGCGSGFRAGSGAAPAQSLHLPVFDRNRLSNGDLLDFAVWMATKDMKQAAVGVPQQLEAMRIGL